MHRNEEGRKETVYPMLYSCAIGGILMAAGDWLLGCVPLQKTDTGMFNRACYLSGASALWKPALVVGMGALGCFLYSFMVKALNTDIDARYTRTKAIQYFCGLFTVVVAWRSISGRLLWRGFLPIWGRVSEWRPRLRRLRPIRMICSPRSSPCMFRCYWFLVSIL